MLGCSIRTICCNRITQGVVMLDASLKSQLQTYLERVSLPIELRASLDDSAKAVELRELLQEIATLSEKITYVEDAQSNQRKPSFTIQRVGTDIGVQFAGIPMGHEFTSLVLALLQVGGHPIKLEQDVIDQVKDLDGEYNFEVYISLSCQNCPDVVQALTALCVINPRIQVVTIDGALYQDEVEKREIQSVPSIYLNDELFGQGRRSAEEILAK